MSKFKQKPQRTSGRPRIERIPATAQLVLDGIAEGLGPAKAFEAAGICRRTFGRWKKRWPQLCKAMAEAKAKHKQTRIQRALDEVAAARAAKLAGEAPVAQTPTPLPPNTRLSATESTDRFGRVWRTPSVCLQKPLASGELRWRA